jgi:hypothetical protein
MLSLLCYEIKAFTFYIVNSVIHYMEKYLNYRDILYFAVDSKGPWRGSCSYCFRQELIPKTCKYIIGDAPPKRLEGPY